MLWRADKTEKINNKSGPVGSDRTGMGWDGIGHMLEVNECRSATLTQDSEVQPITLTLNKNT